MTTLIRGELIKATTTRTIFAYGAMAVALAVAQVLVSILAASDDPMSLADKTESIAGLPLLVLLLGIVGAAGEYRHRTAAPAALVAGRDRGSLLLARAGAYAPRRSRWPSRRRRRVTLAVGLPLLAGRARPGARRRRRRARRRRDPRSPRRCRARFGVALGALVRNQVVAVTGTLVVIFVVLPLVQAINGDGPRRDAVRRGAGRRRAPRWTTLSVGRGGRRPGGLDGWRR